MIIFLYYSLCFLLHFLVWCLISGPSSSPILSLNSIAYRRVICVYQYQVADDLSGRSTSFKPCSIFLLLFLTHAVPSGLCGLMHFSLKTPCWTLVCWVPSCCTNIHPVLRLKAPGCSQHCFQPVDWLVVTSFTVWTSGMETANYCLPVYIYTHSKQSKCRTFFLNF